MPLHVMGYVQMLQGLLKKLGVRTVLDLGCGDWQFSRLIDWSGIDYVGIDVVPSVIEKNQAEHSKSNVRFLLHSGDFSNLPKAELLIVKDVMQHWSNQSIFSFLPVMRTFPLSLVTNCVNPERETVNRDIPDGEYRYLDIRLPPFSISAQEVYEFKNYKPFPLRLFAKPRWCKKVLLVQSQATS